MKRFNKSLIAVILLLTLIFTTLLPVSAAGTTLEYSDKYNSGERDVVCTTLDGTNAENYYNGSYTYDRLSELDSDELLLQLRGLMKSTHKKISSYDNCRDMAVKTDCENEDGRVLLIYTSYSATRSQWDGWNREHVWPKSLGGNNTNGGGADLHHIRPSDKGVNSSRGNKKYGEAGTGASAKYGTDPAVGELGGYYNSTYFEPLDNVKGDVARICLYVYVRWGSEWGATSITKVFQSVDVLLEWCALDPVDTWEMGRNEVVEAYQGNRNVFIDYPELAWLLFDREIPDDMVTPSGEAMEGSGGVTPDPKPDPGPTVCEHDNTEIRNEKAADCKNNGYTGDVYCTDCDEKISSGTNIPSTGEHTWSEPVVKNPATERENGSAESVCTVCGTTKFIVIPALGALPTDNPFWSSDEEMIVFAIIKDVFDRTFLGLVVKETSAAE